MDWIGRILTAATFFACNIPAAFPTGIQSVSPNQSDSLKKNDRHWFTLLKRGELDLKDTTVFYPRFPKFCVNAYNAIDHAINFQDTTYVLPTGHNWNIHITNDSWRDTYVFNIRNRTRITMLSDIYQTLGAYLQYSSISLGYSFDLTNLLGETPSNHKKFNFGISAARFNLEANFWDNTGGTFIRTFTNVNNGHLIKVHFPGASQRTVSLTGDYYFNHERFSMGAAYSASRIQRRSAGTPVIGFNLQRIDVTLDFNQLSPDLLPFLTINPDTYRIHYNSYALSGGYSYNWVLTPRFLWNLTLYPGVGYTHTYGDSIQREKDQLDLMGRAKTAFTLNLRDLYICTTAQLIANRFQTPDITLVSAIYNGNLSIGYRF